MQERERRASYQALAEWARHPGWEIFRLRCLGAPGQEGCLREELEVQKDNCLRGNDLSGARYYQGHVEMLKKICSGDLISSWLEELK